MKNTKSLTVSVAVSLSFIPGAIFAQTLPVSGDISQADLDALLASSTSRLASIASSSAAYQAQLAAFRAQFEQQQTQLGQQSIIDAQNKEKSRMAVVNSLQELINQNRGIIPDAELNALSSIFTTGNTGVGGLGAGSSNTSSSVSTSVTFSRNLKQGDQGEDVRLLQRILNTDPDTRVAAEGAGSPGQETDFFGKKTYFAVIAFQNKYYKEVLLPAGLEVGSGFVGQYTRNKLNDLLAKGVLPK